MNKTILIIFLALLAGIGSLYFAKLNSSSKMAPVSAMMHDLQSVQSTSVTVPADGQWHNRLAFDRMDGQHVIYEIKEQQLKRNNKSVAAGISDLRIRRLSSDPDLLEVQLQAQSTTSMSNFKMRLTGAAHE